MENETHISLCEDLFFEKRKYLKVTIGKINSFIEEKPKNNSRNMEYNDHDIDELKISISALLNELYVENILDRIDFFITEFPKYSIKIPDESEEIITCCTLYIRVKNSIGRDGLVNFLSSINYLDNYKIFIKELTQILWKIDNRCCLNKNNVKYRC